MSLTWNQYRWPARAPGTVTEVKEFEGPHLLPSIEGWEAVADHALEWALRHAETDNLGSD